MLSRSLPILHSDWFPDTCYLSYPKEVPPPAPPMDKGCLLIYYGFEITEEIISNWEEKVSEKIVLHEFDYSASFIPRLMRSVCKRVGLGDRFPYGMSIAEDRRESSPCKTDVVYFASVSEGREALYWAPSRELVLKVGEALGVEGPRWIKV